MDPERLGRFEIGSRLGSGGMGTVYSCRDTETGEAVAVKVLGSGVLEDPEKFRRFEQEVVALSRIRHPNIVRLVGTLERDGERVFFPMELLEGETLSARLRREGPMPVPGALAVIRPLLTALASAHRAGVVHRDIKPSNIILTDVGPKVTDFGLARLEDLTRLTGTGQLMGTLDYMSPEQCDGRPVDHRSDLYSAGVVLFEMLAGRPPFRKESPGAVLKGHLQDAPPRLERIRADLPPGLAEVVARLLRKKPEERYGSAEETLEALSEVRDPSVTVSFHRGTAPAELSEAATRPAPAPRRRGRRIVAAVAGVLLVAAAVTALTGGFGRLPDPAGPLRDTPEHCLESIHAAIRSGDHPAFAACFEEAALREHLPALSPDAFRRAAREVADPAYRFEVPLRGASHDDLSIRVGSSPGLAKVLGLNPAEAMRVSFRSGPGGFRVARVSVESRPRRPPWTEAAEAERRMLLTRLEELFPTMGRTEGPLFERMVEGSGVRREEVKRKLEALAASGSADFEVLEEESTFEPGRAEVVIRSRALAEALELPDDRFVMEFTRTARERRWRPRGIRPLGR